MTKQVSKVKRSQKRERVAEVGEKLTEAIREHPRPKVKEKYGHVVETVDTYKEQLGDETELYGTATAGFIEEAFQPDMLAMDMIQEVTLDMAGYDSLKVPKHRLLEASKVNADGTFSGSEETTGYGEVKIEVEWYGTYTSIPLNLAQKSAVDLIADRLGQIGNAISRKVDQDIITEFEKAGTKNDEFYGDIHDEEDIVNYNYLGDDNFIDWEALFQSVANHRDLNADPNGVLASNQGWFRLHNDEDFKRAVSFGTTAEGAVPQVQQIGTLTLMSSQHVSENKVVLVDGDNAGYFIDASPIENWDGRVDNTIQIQVVGAKAYGVRMVRPEAVYVIHEDDAEPE